jgi:hypothetical protein
VLKDVQAIYPTIVLPLILQNASLLVEISFSLGRHDHSTATKLPPPNSLLEKGRKTLTSRIMALLAKFHGSERAGLNLRKGKQYTGTKKTKNTSKKN